MRPDMSKVERHMESVNYTGAGSNPAALTP